jgi:hypothetical protein
MGWTHWFHADTQIALVSTVIIYAESFLAVLLTPI